METEHDRIIAERARADADYIKKYDRAAAAERAFTAECERQFGASASDDRYNTSIYDAFTLAAAARKHEADDELHGARDALRKADLILVRSAHRVSAATKDPSG